MASPREFKTPPRKIIVEEVKLSDAAQLSENVSLEEIDEVAALGEVSYSSYEEGLEDDMTSVTTLTTPGSPVSILHDFELPPWVDSATITGRERLGKDQPLKFIIQVKEGGKEPWEARRRYTDFVLLKSKLKRHCNMKIDFPGRLLRASTSGLDTRQRLLNRYLNMAITASGQYSKMQNILASFLGFSEADRWQEATGPSPPPPSPTQPSTPEKDPAMKKLIELTGKEAQVRGNLGVQQHSCFLELSRHYADLVDTYQEALAGLVLKSSPWVKAVVTGRVEEKSRPTAYQVTVTADHGESWVVMRRFNEFACLRESLREVVSTPDPPFPSRLFFKPSPAALDSRQAMLGEYLSTMVVASQPSSAMRQIVSKFVCAV